MLAAAQVQHGSVVAETQLDSIFRQHDLDE